MKKKIFVSILTATLVATSIVGCGRIKDSVKPEEIVSTFMESVKNFDGKGMDAISLSEGNFEAIEKDMEDIGTADFIRENNKKVTYNVKKVSGTEKSTKVDVDISFIDAGSTFMSVANELISLESQIKNEEDSRIYSKKLLIEHANDEFSIVNATATFELEKKDNEWKISFISLDSDETVYDLILSGFYSAILNESSHDHSVEDGHNHDESGHNHPHDEGVYMEEENMH